MAWQSILSAFAPALATWGLNKLTGSKGSGFSGGIAPSQVGYGQLTPSQLTKQNSLASDALSTGFGSIMSKFNSPVTQIGMGLLSAGLNKKSPSMPAMPESVNRLRSTIDAGGSPLAQFSTDKLRGMMSQEFSPLNEAEIEAGLRQYRSSRTKQRDQINDLYRGLRPGSSPDVDTTWNRELSDFDQETAQGERDFVANRTRDVKNIFDQQRIQQLQLSLNASNEQMQQLVALSQLDLSAIMAKLNMDYSEALYFKQLFGQMGSQLMMSGLGVSPTNYFLLGRN